MDGDRIPRTASLAGRGIRETLIRFGTAFLLSFGLAFFYSNTYPICLVFYAFPNIHVYIYEQSLDPGAFGIFLYIDPGGVGSVI